MIPINEETDMPDMTEDQLKDALSELPKPVYNSGVVLENTVKKEDSELTQAVRTCAKEVIGEAVEELLNKNKDDIDPEERFGQDTVFISVPDKGSVSAFLNEAANAWRKLHKA